MVTADLDSDRLVSAASSTPPMRLYQYRCAKARWDDEHGPDANVAHLDVERRHLPDGIDKDGQLVVQRGLCPRNVLGGHVILRRRAPGPTTAALGPRLRRTANGRGSEERLRRKGTAGGRRPSETRAGALQQEKYLLCRMTHRWPCAWLGLHGVGEVVGGTQGPQGGPRHLRPLLLHTNTQRWRAGKQMSISGVWCAVLNEV